MEKLSEYWVKIAGHCYGVRLDQAGSICETCCIGRWDWSSAPTGDSWLDSAINSAVLNHEMVTIDKFSF